jgi:hypothetical protein
MHFPSHTIYRKYRIDPPSKDMEAVWTVVNAAWFGFAIHPALAFCFPLWAMFHDRVVGSVLAKLPLPLALCVLVAYSALIFGAVFWLL